MKLKLSDLKLLMQYLVKEGAEMVEIEIDRPIENGTVFSFRDIENRECHIKLYDAQFNITPELTKKMKLYTRFSKENESGDSEA